MIGRGVPPEWPCIERTLVDMSAQVDPARRIRSRRRSADEFVHGGGSSCTAMGGSEVVLRRGGQRIDDTSLSGGIPFPHMGLAHRWCHGPRYIGDFFCLPEHVTGTAAEADLSRRRRDTTTPRDRMDSYTITITPDDQSGNSTTLTVDTSTGQARITSVHLNAPAGLTGGQMPNVDVQLLLQAVTGATPTPASITAGPTSEPRTAPEPVPAYADVRPAESGIDEQPATATMTPPQPPADDTITPAPAPTAPPAGRTSPRRATGTRTPQRRSPSSSGPRRGRNQPTPQNATPEAAPRKAARNAARKAAATPEATPRKATRNAARKAAATPEATPRKATAEAAPRKTARKATAEAAPRKTARKATAEATPRKATRRTDGRTERVYRRMPDDFAAVYRQASTAAAIADHYDVPRYTAQGWIGRYKKQDAAAGR
jgi:hypothetical protein